MLIDAKAITPDEGIEDFLRSAYGLPARPKGDGDGTPAVGGMTKAEVAELAATVSQKVYLAVNADVVDRDEARDLIRMAGADLKEVHDDPSPEPDAA